MKGGINILHLILSSSNTKEVVNVLHKNDYTTDDYSIKYAEKNKGVVELLEASRIPVNVLIVDLETGPNLGSAILRYRVNRPHTRIILLAFDAVPGNQEVAKIVQAGVYDVVTHVSCLAEVLRSKPPGIETIAKWIDPELAPDEIKKTENEIIYKEKIVGITVIVVSGASRGVGTTTFSLQAAHFLAQYGRVALIELNQYPAFYALEDYKHKKIDIYPQSKTRNIYVKEINNFLNSVDMQNYTFIILDLGAIYEVNHTAESKEDYIKNILKLNPYAHEMNRAKIPILVCGAFDWQYWNLHPLLNIDDFNIKNKNISLVLREPKNKQFIKDVAGAFKDVSVYPNIEDPLEIKKEEEREFMKGLLERVIPAEKRSKKKFFNFLVKTKKGGNYL